MQQTYKLELPLVAVQRFWLKESIQTKTRKKPLLTLWNPLRHYINCFSRFEHWLSRRILAILSAPMDTKRIESTLRQILEHFNFQVGGVKISEEESGMIRVDIESPEASRMIGWHGETLNAIQSVLKSIIRTAEKLEKAPFILLDVDGYRRMQEEKVCKIAEQKAEFVRKTGSRVALSPMSPYFRRVVHTHVANTPALSDLTTESVGEGEYRQIVLKLKNSKDRRSEELSPVIKQDDGLENLDI